MPVKRLPSNPNLDHLKYQAKDLITGHAAHDQAVAQRIRELLPPFSAATDAAIFNAPLPLSSAQLAIAREHGFPSWPRLKAHIEKPARGRGGAACALDVETDTLHHFRCNGGDAIIC